MSALCSLCWSKCRRVHRLTPIWVHRSHDQGGKRITTRRRAMKSISRITLRSLLAVTLVLAQFWLASGVGAQALPPQNPSQFDVTGFIQAATLDNPLDPLSGGTITVNNQVIIVPRNTILQMPAAALTWQEVFAQAPAPYGIPGNPGVTVSVPTSGLARSDVPRPLGTYEVHVVGNRVG